MADGKEGRTRTSRHPFAIAYDAVDVASVGFFGTGSKGHTAARCGPGPTTFANDHRFPGLKPLLAHGGGYVPYGVSRMDEIAGAFEGEPYGRLTRRSDRTARP